MTPNGSITYFASSDTLYIDFSDKKAMVGSEEYQEGVAIFRKNDDMASEIIGFEIIDFSHFEENLIRISESETLDMSKSFKIFRTVVDMLEFEEIDRATFESLIETLGFKKKKQIIFGKKKFKNPDLPGEITIPLLDKIYPRKDSQPAMT